MSQADALVLLLRGHLGLPTQPQPVEVTESAARDGLPPTLNTSARMQSTIDSVDQICRDLDPNTCPQGGPPPKIILDGTIEALAFE